MFGIGMPELLIILVIALLIFGAGKMPEVGSGLGKAIREFKQGIYEAKSGKETPEGEQEKQAKELEETEETEETLIDQLPGAREVKNLQTKASTVKKWSRLLFR